MKKILAFFYFLPFFLHAQTVSYQTLPSTGTGTWTNRVAELINLQPGFVPISPPHSDFNRFGSFIGLKTTATGFFRVEKINDRWWFIDPDGYAGLNVAVNSMNGVTASSQVQVAYDRLWELGFNGIGNFLANENFTRDYYIKVAGNENKQFSYTRRLNFYAGYAAVRGSASYYPGTPAAATASSTRLNYVFALDPKFPQYCAAAIAKNITQYQNETNLLGYFLDNELSFNQDQLALYLSTTETDPAYIAASKFVADEGVSLTAAKNGTVTEAIKQKFAGIIAERYYFVCDSLLKIYDPNHLNLGSRLNGRPRDIESVVEASAKYCDVVSVNFYDKYQPNDQITSNLYWNKWIDKPCLVTEFYVKGLDASTAGYVNGFSGAGWVVKTQTERGYFYQNTTLQLLESKNFVGWHYFKHMDDADSNKGMMNTSKVEYTDLTSQMKLVNDNRYEYLSYLGVITNVENVQAVSFNVTTKAKDIIISGITGNYEIISLAGTTIASGKVTNSMTITAGNPGFYLVKVVTPEGTGVKKIIVK